MPLLTRFEENDLIARMKSGGRDAERSIKRLVEAHLRLVVFVARKYEGRGLEILDLIQAGNIGLLAAAKNFEELRRYNFATWAGWWIRRSIVRELERPRTDGVPVHMRPQ